MLIQRCLEDSDLNGTYDITGLEKVSYLSLMRQLRKAVNARTWIIIRRSRSLSPVAAKSADLLATSLYALSAQGPHSWR